MTQPGYTCPTCHRTSYHPEDLRHRYCSACGVFEADECQRLQVEQLLRDRAGTDTVLDEFHRLTTIPEPQP